MDFEFLNFFQNMEFDLESVVLNASYGLIVIALLVRDILWLRSIIIVSELCMISYGLIVGNSMIPLWNSVFLAINSIQVIRLLLERRPIQLPPELLIIYEKVFRIMSKREFLYFWNTGKRFKEDDNYLCKEGEIQQELMLIISGEVIIEKLKKEITRLSTGSFVAEMSFLTSEPASADVKSNGCVEYIAWSQEQLKNLNHINPDLLIKIQVIIGKDLSSKLKSSH